MPQSSMVNLRGAHRPSISYRPIRLSDLEVVEKLHGDLFPIRYESEFFLNVVNGRDIVSWGAVDRNRPNGQSDELIGFVTARIVMAKESEIEDMLRFETARVDQTLVYILTLGVVGSYRNLGIATSLIREIIKYSSNIQTCQAVYLHVISYNNSAIHLYKKMSFQCVRRLHEFYFINGQHYDSYLFVLYVNGGRSPCSPLELVTILVAYIRSGFKLVASRLWRKKERKVPRWLEYTESGGGRAGLLPMTQNKRIVTTEVTGSHKITYHNGPILTGEINLSILWYGKVKEQQKSQLRLFISSLNTGKNVTLEPRVIDWWRMVESYQLLADKKLKRSAPKITVNLVKEVDDDHPTPTNLRDADFKDVVNKLVAGDNGKTISVIVLGEKVEWESARSRCFMHNFDGEQMAIVVVNQMGKAKNNCGWPFFAPEEGNVGFLVPAPTEAYADLMVIHFASALAGTVTNPQDTGFFSDDKEEETDSLLDIGSMCKGIFGTGAFPGYAGRVRVDPHSGAGFNAHGLNSTKFMLPAIVNPKDGSCWTTL